MLFLIFILLIGHAASDGNALRDRFFVSQSGSNNVDTHSFIGKNRSADYRYMFLLAPASLIKGEKLTIRNLNKKI